MMGGCSREQEKERDLGTGKKPPGSDGVGGRVRQ